MKNLCINCQNYIPDEKDKFMGICATTGKVLCEYTRRPHYAMDVNVILGGKNNEE